MGQKKRSDYFLVWKWHFGKLAPIHLFQLFSYTCPPTPSPDPSSHKWLPGSSWTYQALSGPESLHSPPDILPLSFIQAPPPVPSAEGPFWHSSSEGTPQALSLTSLFSSCGCHLPLSVIFLFTVYFCSQKQRCKSKDPSVTVSSPPPPPLHLHRHLANYITVCWMNGKSWQLSQSPFYSFEIWGWQRVSNLPWGPTPGFTPRPSVTQAHISTILRSYFCFPSLFYTVHSLGWASPLYSHLPQDHDGFSLRWLHAWLFTSSFSFLLYLSPQKNEGPPVTFPSFCHSPHT